MAGPFKLKGSPMARNFGAPFRNDKNKTIPLTEAQKASRERAAKLETQSNEKRTNHADYEEHNYRANKTKVYGAKKTEDNFDSENAWTAANNILINNATNANRKAEVKVASKKATELSKGETKKRAYNVSRGEYIKKTQEINQSGKGKGGTIKQTASHKTAKKATYKNTGRKA